MASTLKLNALMVGQVKVLSDGLTQSAIDKSATSEPQYLSKTGFKKDQQSDLRHHGGLEKAVHHYAFEHYDYWSGILGNPPLLNKPGAFGENLSTTGLTEKQVAIGDVYQLGNAVIQVSQGRQPCFKLNIRFGHKQMAAMVQKTGLTGWYYRVLEEGFVAPDDDLFLKDRTAEHWTIEKLWRILYVEKNNWTTLEEMVELDVLSQSWRELAKKRLQARRVEDWSARLEGNQNKS